VGVYGKGHPQTISKYLMTGLIFVVRGTYILREHFGKHVLSGGQMAATVLRMAPIILDG
jgi:hypothetical protein